MLRSQILTKALATMQRHGWKQGGYGGAQDPSGGVCAMIAMRVDSGGETRNDAVLLLCNIAKIWVPAMAREERRCGSFVIDWNDDTERKWKDVRSAFEQAITVAKWEEATGQLHELNVPAPKPANKYQELDGHLRAEFYAIAAKVIVDAMWKAGAPNFTYSGLFKEPADVLSVS